MSFRSSKKALQLIYSKNKIKLYSGYFMNLKKMDGDFTLKYEFDIKYLE